MKKILLLLNGLLLLNLNSIAQETSDKILYVIDSIPVIEDPAPGNEIMNTDIADLTVIKNKDSLKLIGYNNFDGVIYIFTKEYRNRSTELKSIPSTGQMTNKNGTWYYHDILYTGKFIDYYYNGKKQSEGTLLYGKVNGERKMYYQNGKLIVEGNYSNGVENGIEKEYFEDGSLKQKGEFVNGKEEGAWKMYFPNGQVKQSSTFINGEMDGETTVYYSTGKILAIEVTKKGKTIPDKRLEKISRFIVKGNADNKKEDYKSAIKNYTKSIEIDSTYAEAYFARGTAKLNDFQFDDAILDFDRALKFEPYYEEALSNRAFARIRKYQFAGSRKLSETNGVTILASKDNPGIPKDQLTFICNDLQTAIFLGDTNRMVLNAVKEFCDTTSSD